MRADAAQIEQVIVNLVVNARDAMPDGGKLTIETQNVTLGTDFTEPARRHGAWRVRAHGVHRYRASGWIRRRRDRIFEPFFTTKAAGQGTGLGLATVYGIVKQSGGSLSVYSEPDRGSTFKVYLPRVTRDRRRATRRRTHRPRAEGTETVLLVEDEAVVRQLAARALRDARLPAAGGRQRGRGHDG